MTEISLSGLRNGHVIAKQAKIDCLPWELSGFISELKCVHVVSVLEYLTTMEADASLIDLFKVLQIGGEIQVSVPDSEVHMKRWINAEWNEETLTDPQSTARQSFEHIFGKQSQCNPKLEDYNRHYADVHKSGYTVKRLKYLLQRVGFDNIEISKVNDNIVAKAEKTMHRGERQIAPTYDSISIDHKHRYQFACRYLSRSNVTNILDLACGIGYGSKMLSEACNVPITGIDIDSGAISYAKKYYSNEFTHFVEQDARNIDFGVNTIDAIVSFETIEHVSFDKQLLEIFNRILVPNGIFICSTPNENTMPFDAEKFPFHIKHYSPSEFYDLLEISGFEVLEKHTQIDSKSGKITEGTHGCFNLAICRKVDVV